MQQYLSLWNVVNVLYIINLIFRTSEQKISFFWWNNSCCSLGLPII